MAVGGEARRVNLKFSPSSSPLLLMVGAEPTASSVGLHQELPVPSSLGV